MEVRLENTASATTNNDPAHCFVAIELSKSSWVLGFQTSLAKQTSRYQVKACDAKAREIKRLEIVLEMISTVEAERDAILTEKKSTHLNADKIKMLAKLKAIGAEFSTTLVALMLDHRRCATSRAASNDRCAAARSHRCPGWRRGPLRIRVGTSPSLTLLNNLLRKRLGHFFVRCGMPPAHLAQSSGDAWLLQN
jgi:superfamily II DNA helicase RecQ